MLHICSEHFEQKDEEEKEKDSKDKDKDKDKKAEKSDDGSHQGVAVLGIALMAMGEEIGAQMVLRTCNHLVCIQDKSPFKIFLSSYFECQQKKTTIINVSYLSFAHQFKLFWVVDSIFVRATNLKKPCENFSRETLPLL